MQEIAAELTQKVKTDFEDGKPASQPTDGKKSKKSKKEKLDVTHILSPELEGKSLSF